MSWVIGPNSVPLDQPVFWRLTTKFLKNLGFPFEISVGSLFSFNISKPVDTNDIWVANKDDGHMISNLELNSTVHVIVQGKDVLMDPEHAKFSYVYTGITKAINMTVTEPTKISDHQWSYTWKAPDFWYSGIIITGVVGTVNIKMTHPVQSSPKITWDTPHTGAQLIAFPSKAPFPNLMYTTLKGTGLTTVTDINVYASSTPTITGETLKLKSVSYDIYTTSGNIQEVKIKWYITQDDFPADIGKYIIFSISDGVNFTPFPTTTPIQIKHGNFTINHAPLNRGKSKIVNSHTFTCVYTGGHQSPSVCIADTSSECNNTGGGECITSTDFNSIQMFMFPTNIDKPLDTFTIRPYDPKKELPDNNYDNFPTWKSLVTFATEVKLAPPNEGFFEINAYVEYQTDGVTFALAITHESIYSTNSYLYTSMHPNYINGGIGGTNAVPDPSGVMYPSNSKIDPSVKTVNNVQIDPYHWNWAVVPPQS